MAFILINTFTELATLKIADVSLLAELVGSTDVFGLQLAQQTFCNIFLFALSSANIMNFFMCVQSALSKTHVKPAEVALLGLAPLLVFYAATYLLFAETVWAFANPSLACLLLFPGYSLMCSRQIVCNFTEMECDPLPKSFLWFLLFPLNRRAGDILRK